MLRSHPVGNDDINMACCPRSCHGHRAGGGEVRAGPDRKKPGSLACLAAGGLQRVQACQLDDDNGDADAEVMVMLMLR